MHANPATGVLVVEDEDQLLTLVASILEGEGFGVFRASDGEAALRVFVEHRQAIRIVLTDLGLPAMGGLDLIRQLRMEAPGVKIIGVSAMQGKQVAGKAIDAGADCFLPKPFTMSEVVSTVRTMLGTA